MAKRGIALAVWLLLIGVASGQTVSRLDRAIRAVCPAVVGVSPRGSTWVVFPATQQACAQPVIDAFNPTDPAHGQAELTAAVVAALDQDRLTSAVLWEVLRQVFPADTDAQRKTRYRAIRQLVIDAYKAQPWK